MTCTTVCAAAIVATLLHAERSNAFAGTPAAAESYPILLVSADDAQAPSGSAAPAANADLPANLVVPPTLRPLLTKMWTHSQTFRRQCARLRAEPRLVVRVHTDAAGAPRGGQATTQIERGATGLVADVYLELANRNASSDWTELIAHEFEHIIEQLDGLDLSRLARVSPDTVWVTAGRQVFETQRARYTGRVVAAEVVRAE